MVCEPRRNSFAKFKTAPKPGCKTILQKMPQFYFLRTIRHGSTNKLRPVAFQVNENNEPIQTALNVQANMTMRSSYPVGTVFGTQTLELKSNSATPFYSAGAIFPLGLASSDYLNVEDFPSKEMADAWTRYMVNHPDWDKDQMFGGGASGSSAVNSSTLLARLRAEPRFAKPTIESDGFFIEDRNWQLLLRNILTKTNTMLIGPTGTGKTELVQLACRKMGVECNDFDMGSMHDAMSEMLGVHRLGADGSEFDYAKFTEVVQRPGVVLLDELSRAPVTTNNILFPCLDSRRKLPVEIAGGRNVREIKVHPDCVFVATANIGAEYTGTMTLDRALMGRFFPLELGYMPQNEEVGVLVKRYGIGKNDALNIVSVAGSIRSINAKGELSCSVSTRETLMAASLVRDGWSAMESMQLTFLPLFEGTTVEGERSIVAKTFMTR